MDNEETWEGGNSLEPEDEEKKVYLVCNRDGDVLGITSLQTWDEAYDNTIGLNYGEILIEIDELRLKEIENRFAEVRK